MRQWPRPPDALDLYLDTADRAAWADLMPTGLFRGITTNPLLAQRAGLDYPSINWTEMAQRAHDLGALELHGQVYGSVESYLDWAKRLYDAGEAVGLRTVVKIPMTPEALRAVPSIRALGGPILLTAVYNPKQVIVAKALHADFVAPYFGRMDEAGIPALDHLTQMQAIAKGTPRVLVASLRNSDQLVALAARGLDCFTLSPDLARSLLSDPMTEEAAAAFEIAAASQSS